MVLVPTRRGNGMRKSGLRLPQCSTERNAVGNGQVCIIVHSSSYAPPQNNHWRSSVSGQLVLSRRNLRVERTLRAERPCQVHAGLMLGLAPVCVAFEDWSRTRHGCAPQTVPRRLHLPTGYDALIAHDRTARFAATSRVRTASSALRTSIATRTSTGPTLAIAGRARVDANCDCGACIRAGAKTACSFARRRRRDRSSGATAFTGIQNLPAVYRRRSESDHMPSSAAARSRSGGLPPQRRVLFRSTTLRVARAACPAPNSDSKRWRRLEQHRNHTTRCSTGVPTLRAHYAKLGVSRRASVGASRADSVPKLRPMACFASVCTSSSSAVDGCGVAEDGATAWNHYSERDKCSASKPGVLWNGTELFVRGGNPRFQRASCPPMTACDSDPTPSVNSGQV